MDDDLPYLTDTSPIVSRTAFTPSVPLTETVLAAWSPGTLWQVLKVDMEGEDVIGSHHPNPWPRTLDNSIYEDLFKVLGPTWLFGENGLSTQSDDFVKNLTLKCSRRSALTVVPSVHCPLHAYMNPVPGHGVCINESTVICTACGDRPGSTTPGSPHHRFPWLLPGRFLRPILGR